jgi:hypothetical protein
MPHYIKADQGLHNTVIYTTDDGKYFRYSKGTWTWRNHNPGNAHPGKVSKRHSQIGVAGKMAVFPDRETGHNALLDSLSTIHSNQSIDQLIYDYAPPKENPHFLRYKKFLHKQTGVMDNKKIRDFTPDEFEKLWKAIEQFEGWKEGDIVEVYQVECVNVDKKSVISKYCINTAGWVSKEECLKLAKQGKIDAEICKSELGNPYLRVRAHSSFQKRFDDIIKK